MREFKGAYEMKKITGTYRLSSLMLDIENRMVERAQNGHFYVMLDMTDLMNEYRVSFDDISFIFNELKRVGYIVEDEGELWTVRWDV